MILVSVLNALAGENVCVCVVVCVCVSKINVHVLNCAHTVLWIGGG